MLLPNSTLSFTKLPSGDILIRKYSTPSESSSIEYSEVILRDVWNEIVFSLSEDEKGLDTIEEVKEEVEEEI